MTCRDAMRCDAAVTVRGGGLTAGKAVVAGVNRRRQHKSEQGDEAAGKVNLDNTLDNTLEMLERIATGSQVDLGEVVTMRRRLLSGACATP